MSRSILHCDMNNFYASVECMLDPVLKKYPVAVCGSVEERHGIVLAKNYAAKAFGIKTGDAVWQAKQKCRNLVVVPPHFEEYIKYSKLARSVYQRYTDQVEPYGMDECWLDISGTDYTCGSPEKVANDIRETIKFELGLTISVGVSFNKIFAKLGSDMKKPDAVTVIPKDSFQEKIWGLPAADLLGVGRATQRVLDSYCIRTIGDLAKTDPDFLNRRLGKNGIALWQYANGNDRSRVMNADFVSPVKSVGHGITTIEDLENDEQVWPVFLELTQDIGHKLRVHKKCADGVAIHIRDNTLFSKQWQTALDNQLDWYKPILAARPDWTLTAQYIDEGITGTSAEKRPQFMKMVEDARQKKFNMIITREVSRFARNTVDTLQYTRLLKEYGVEVFFLNDNIKTFDGDGELRLTIMATLAQDESRKTSIRVKAGQQTSMQNGVFYGNGNILGYDRVGKEMVINPEQAKTVRMIYDMYLSGMGVTAIQYELEKAGRLTAMGKERWFASYIAKMLRNSFYCGIITYHKEYTPDFLKQKKIKNYGDLEYVQVQGTHEPIVTVEEYEQVQKLMDAKSALMKNHNKGKRRVGRMQHTTAYGRLMICQCGNKFNLRFHSRDGRTDGVDYQCYTSVNRGSVTKRLNKGISIEHSCESPYIQGWKLEMMAEQVFDRYIENADKVMDLSYAMLEKHIADQEELPDNTDVIQRKQGEIEKLMNKRTNLIEMRAEGDIDKEMFRSKKQEIEDRVAKLTEEIKGLQPEKELTSNEDYSVKLLELRERLKEYTGFDYSVIPESIVEAFIERIWVSKDEFRWYLRTGNKAEGEFDPDDHIKIGSFTLTIDDAKKYIYSFSTRRRVYKWVDLNVSVWI